MYAAWMFWSDRFKDVYFPDTENWNAQATILQNESSWPLDLTLQFRAFEGRVYLSLPDGFTCADGDTDDEKELVPDRQVELNVPYGGVITIILARMDRASMRFVKYHSNNNVITLGRLSQNLICDEDDNVSGDHGYLDLRQRDYAEYTDYSSNGTYLNGRRINNSTVRLQFGDTLVLPSGLKLLYLGDLLAVNQIESISHINLVPAQPPVPNERRDIRSLPSLYVEYHRAPRIMTKVNAAEIEIEPPIPKQDQRKQPVLLQIGPSATMILPMAMGTMAMSLSNSGRGFGLSGLAMIGTSSVLAVMWGLINRRYQSREEYKAEHTRISLYQQYIQEMEQELKNINEQEYSRLVSTFPNVGDCALMPGDLSARQLWNRMPTHSDFLEVRLGTGEVSLPGEITTPQQKLSIIDDPLRSEPDRLKRVYSVIADAPFTVKLRGESVVGILGGEEAVLFAQGMMLQIAALHSYHDVRIAVLTDEDSASQWEWARWLPHVFTNEDREMRMIASKPAIIHDIMNHIDDVLVMRQNDDEEAGGAAPSDEELDVRTLPLPHYLIVCTNYRLLENEPVMRKLLTRQLGTTLVMIAPSMEMLPKESHLIINLSTKPGFLHTSDGDTQPVDFEYPNPHLLRTFAESMAPIRVHDVVETAAIPTLVSFLDIYNVRRVEDLDVWRMWTENHTDQGLRSVIGYTSGSRPFVLDISENYHGPHGLIAGTTGSGKSVMLQTYILSLALNYSPEAVQFILIDYKGGGMADAFRTLPHVVGIIDNLQGEQVISRALASLKGELHRREILFKEMKVKDIIDYTRQYSNDPDAPALSHLIIIADEFAELKSDQPDFMKELVSASRIGRSLGVHLILATQKPAGSVSDEIWANSRFHLCLRVQTVADSRDMLKRPDAAYIKGTGRCFIQIGNDESFDQVQTSYSGLTYDPNMPLPEEMPHLLGDAGRVVVVPQKRSDREKEVTKKTQMTAVLERISEISNQHNMSHQRQMWMPEMSAQIYFDQLQLFADNCQRDGVYANRPEGLQFLLGLADDTANQRYLPFVINLTEMRNLLIVGLAGTGKTTMVRSMVYSLASQYDPAHLQMYVLSLSTATLKRALIDFPHVGDIVLEEEVVETQRFINMLYKEEESRSTLFAKAATDSFIEYNRQCEASGKPPVPAIVVFVDRYEQLRSMFENDEATAEKINGLIREGSSRGIHFIVTALAHNEVPYRLHAFFTGLTLQLSERADYSEVLGTRVPIEQPPIARFPGRGLCVIEGNIYEYQTALAGLPHRAPATEDFAGFTNLDRYFIDMPLPLEGATLNDTSRADAVIEMARAQAEAWKGDLPVSIPRIPENPDWTRFIEDPAYGELQTSDFSIPIGYNLSTGEITELDLEENFSLFITGPRKSGRTNLLMFLARVMLARGAQVHVVGDVEWLPFCRKTGAKLYSTPEDIVNFTNGFIQDVLNVRTPLKTAARQEGTRAAMCELARSFEPYTVIMDNTQRFNTDFNAPNLAEGLSRIRDVFGQLSAKGSYYNFQLFMSAPFTAQGSFMQEPLRSLIAQGRGISMGGKVSDCNPLGIAGLMPGPMARRALPLNQGYLITDGKLRQIVVPFAGVKEE